MILGQIRRRFFNTNSRILKTESPKPETTHFIPQFCLIEKKLDTLNHACQRALSFNKTRLSYIKDCALYFVTHGQRPTLLTPTREPGAVHLHQQLALAPCVESDNVMSQTEEEEIL